MIHALKIYHLKRYDLRAKFFSVPKGCLQVDLAYPSCRLAVDHCMKDGLGVLQLFLSQYHPEEGIIIQDVDAAASIHKHFVKCVSSGLWRDYRSESSRVIYH